MNESKPMRTGVPSTDLPWMQYYPPQLIENLEIPEQTIGEYLRAHCPGDDVVAMHYYGNDITWKQLFEQVDATARGLKALGLGEGDAIPTFLRAVPEFIYLLLAAEKNWRVDSLPRQHAGRKRRSGSPLRRKGYLYAGLSLPERAEHIPSRLGYADCGAGISVPQRTLRIHAGAYSGVH